MNKSSQCNKYTFGRPKTSCLHKEILYSAIITLIATLCFLPGLGSFGPLDPTDSFFIEAAREMMERHHYLTALYNYVDWLDKPILSFLPIIISYKLFGINAFAARLPAALSAIILVIATYAFCLPLLGRRVAIFSALILCSTPLFLVTGHLALSDSLLSMFFGISMLLVASVLAQKKTKLSPIAYFFLALAILTKGPIALILGFATIVIFLFLTSSNFSQIIGNFDRLRPFTGTIILIIVCLPYFYLADVTTDGAFTTQFFLQQNVGRMLGTVNHQEPIWFYIPVLFAGFFPWIIYFLISIPWLKRLFLRRYKLTERQKLIIFCVCWLFCVLTLFTLVPTKLPTYIMPMSPAIALIVGSYLDLLIKQYQHHPESIHPWLTQPKVLLSIAPLLSSVAGTMVYFFLPRMSIYKMSGSGIFLLVSFISLISCGFIWTKRYSKGIFTLFIAALSAGALLVPYLLLWQYHFNQVSFNELVIVAKEKDASLATLFSRLPTVIFVLHKAVPEIKSLPELEKFCQNGTKPHLLLATKNCLQLPELKAKQHIIATNGKWYLLDVEHYPWQ